jgi:hypothetical protein
VRPRRLLRLGPLLVAVACGTSEPTPTPTPTPDPCSSSPSEFAVAVTDWWIPACSLAQNIYDDPQEALGPVNAGGSGPDNYTGFISLGFGGHVTVDMGGCISDRSGPDIRVFQAVGNEPVSVYVALSREGPFTLLEARKPCGDRYSGLRRSCDFDLASGGVAKARYVRVEDGELYACPGDTVTEGADLDAIQMLGVVVGSSPDLLR